MDCLNNLVVLVYLRVKLGLFNTKFLGRLHGDCDKSDYNVVVVQEESESYQVVKMIGHPLTPEEIKSSLMEKLLLVLHWGVKKLARYTLWVPELIVVLLHSEEVACMNTSGLNIRLLVQLMEIAAFKCTYECGEGAWAVLREVTHISLCESESLLGSDYKFWDRQEDMVIDRPSCIPPLKPYVLSLAYSMWFDRGCKWKGGSGGIIVFAPNGGCVRGLARYYGGSANTNTKAEYLALIDSLELLANDLS